MGVLPITLAAFFPLVKDLILVAGERRLSRLRSSLLAEDPSSFSSDTHTVAQNCLYSRSRGSEFLF